MKKLLLSFVVASSLFVSNSFANINDGLVAHYEFEGNAKDSSGNGNDGTEHGGVTYVDGVIGKAAKFDGVDDYIKINYDYLFNLEQYDSFTIVLFAKADVNNGVYNVGFYDTPNGDPTLISKDCNSDPTGPYNLYMGSSDHKNSNQNVSFEIQNNNNKINESNFKWPQTSANEFHLILWRHYTNVYEIWIDGKLKLKVHSELEPDSGNRCLLIGRRGWNNGYFNGLIDDLRIYNRALSEDEIKEVYKLGTTTDKSINQETVLYENKDLTGISNAKIINNKIVVGFGILGTAKSGYPTNQKWYSLYMLNGDKQITIDDSTNAANANELSIANINNNIAVVYQKPTGSSYGFDSPFKIYNNNGKLITNEKVFSNANWGCCASMDIDSKGNAHIIQFAHAGYFLNYSTNSSGNWVNNNISGYSTYYHYPKLTIDNNDIPHIITSQLNNTYGTEGKMQHWWKNTNGTWLKETIAMDSTGHGKLVFDKNNNIYGVYVDTNDNLKLITKNNSSNQWTSEVIVSNLNISGKESRIAISKTGKIYIVAKNIDGDTVFLFTKNNSTWKKITLNNNLTPTTNDNSKAPSILFDIDDNPVIIYADDTKIYKYLFKNNSKNDTCTQQITYAQNPKTKTWFSFPNPCEVPDKWKTTTTEPSNFNQTDLPVFNQQECNTTIQTDKNISIPNINTEKLKELSAGWHLLGTGVTIDNLSIFDNVNIVWKWNETKNGWEAYSSNKIMKKLINKNPNVDVLKKIEADKGFWINK